MIVNDFELAVHEIITGDELVISEAELDRMLCLQYKRGYEDGRMDVLNEKAKRDSGRVKPLQVARLEEARTKLIANIVRVAHIVEDSDGT